MTQLFAGDEIRWKLVNTGIFLRPSYLFYPLNKNEIAIFGDVSDNEHELSLNETRQYRAFIFNAKSFKMAKIPWEDRSSPYLKLKYGNYGLEKNFPDNYTIAVKQPDIFSHNSSDMDSQVVAIAITGEGPHRKAESFQIASFPL